MGAAMNEEPITKAGQLPPNGTGRFVSVRSGDIHRRLGPAVPDRTFRRAPAGPADEGQVEGTGDARWRKLRGKGALAHGDVRLRRDRWGTTR